jgi:protein gp37
MPTKIAWTDESWNPVTGCTPVSEGCAHCYAKKMSHRFGGDFSTVTLYPDRLDRPLRWRKPRMVFVPSMGDLFHEDVPYSFINRVFGVMAQRRDHTFQVLTKRPERMRDWVREHVLWLQELAMMMTRRDARASIMPHIWLGVSVENQARANERIPLLLDTPAAVRFVSAEPLLGPLDLWGPRYPLPGGGKGGAFSWGKGISWVICGGESGGPENRRLVERCEKHLTCRMGWPNWRTLTCGECGAVNGWRPKPEALEWVRPIRDQCQAAGVPFWFKQWGPRAGLGTQLDGKEHKEMPEVQA